MKKNILGIVIAFNGLCMFATTTIIVHNKTAHTFKIDVNAPHFPCEAYEQDASYIKPHQTKQALWLHNEPLQQHEHYEINMMLSHRYKNYILCNHRIHATPKQESLSYCVLDAQEPHTTWCTDCSTYRKKIHCDAYSLVVTHKKTIRPDTTIVEYTIEEPRIAQPVIHAPEELKILTWNIDMKPAGLIKNGQVSRAKHIPEFTQDNDIIVFTELFDTKAFLMIAHTLHTEYPYCSVHKHTTAHAENPSLQPGVVIFSKWPIIAQDYVPFSKLCAGFDCFVEKGFAYACINKLGKRYHIIGAMLQDWPTNKAALVRSEQLKKIKEIVHEYDLPKDEPIIFTGSFNINKYKSSFDNKSRSEYKEMLSLLNAELGEHKGHNFTIDPSINKLARTIDPKEYTDYIMYATNHQKPKKFSHEVCIFKSSTPWHEHYKESHHDISSHFAQSAVLSF